MLLTVCAAAAATASTPTAEQFARSADLSHARISPAGNYLSAIRNVQLEGFDKRVLVIFHYPSMQLSATLALPKRYSVADYFWANDERVVARATVDVKRADWDAWVTGLYALSANGGAPQALLPSRHIEVISRMEEDPKRVLVARYVYNSWRADVSFGTLNIYGGGYNEIARARTRNAELFADAFGTVRLSSFVDDELNTLIHSYDADSRRWTLESTTPHLQGAPLPLSVSRDGRHLYLRKATGNAPYGIYRTDLASGDSTLVYQHETADAIGLFDRWGDLWGARHDHGRGETVILDERHPLAAIYAAAASAFPQHTVTVERPSNDYSKAVIAVGSGDATTQWFLYEQAPEGNTMSLLFDEHADIDDASLGRVTPITLTARDGLELHGYLTLPPSAPAGPLPMVVMPHGGPLEIQDRWLFDPDVQLLASNGYAVLQVNFRGSGGYGPHFASLGLGEFAQGIQNDVTDATRWAVDKGYADPKRICIYGWSYGGFSALNGAVREPDLYRCAIGAAGVYDYVLQSRKADYALFRTGKRYTRQAVADSKAALRQMSPVHHAERIKASIMLVHGGEDSRVPVENARRMRAALEKAGNPPVYMEKRHDGHGFASEENRSDFYKALLAFLHEHIGQK